MSAILEEKNNEETLVYPISINYGKKDWNVVSALREFLSNMLDTQVPYQVTYENGMAVISDEGNGLPKKSFIFGESTRDDSQIGQFGEGAKMAFITLLRENRKVYVETAGFNVLVSTLDSKEYGARVMQLSFLPNRQNKGTKVYVQCTPEELENAQSLFLALKEPSRLDEGIYTPGGSVYVLGLRTTTMPNLLFSYNILDKNMTNRDRNIVDASRLNENLIHLLKNAKNQRLIQQYLKGFKEFPTAYEYQLSFLPARDRKDAWIQAMRKVFPKACLSSDMNSDLLAHAMGYQVLRNVPSHLFRVFKELGLKESVAYAIHYQGESLQEKNRLVFPISEQYVSDWTRIDAIREFIANALDAGEPRISHNGKEGRISDSGEGILKKHLVLGNSGKSNQGQTIGKFGEGLKVACLVLARTGTPVKIESIGTTYSAKLEFSEEFDTKLLVIEFQKNNRTKGSSIVFSCKEQELEDAKSRFLHFRGVRKKPVVDDTQKMDIYPGGSGVIFVNGLETAKINALFDYNIRDKALLNSRDRNGVDMLGLRTRFTEFLKKTEDESIITQLITGWRTNNNAFEYDTSVIPRQLSSWSKVVKKLFPKAVFASGHFDENDFIAKQAGYELLMDLPLFVRSIFERSGIVHSSSVAKNYRNKGIQFENKIVYPIVAQYGSTWRIEHALRELIANALDADPKCKIEANRSNGKEFVISDKGEGISKKNFLFGNSDKTRGDQKIGLFGEGLKMAALVFARSKRHFRIQTQGTEYSAYLEYDAQFDAEVLVIQLSPSRKRKGTDIFIESTANEIEQAKSGFLVFNKNFEEIELGIYQQKRKGEGTLFVNGLSVMTSRSLFSYNILDKTLTNRDRSTLNMNILTPLLAKMWSKVSNKKLIEAFLSNKDPNLLESQFNFKPDVSVRNVWEEVTKKVYDKMCFASGTDHDGVARDKGYRLIPGFLPPNLANLLVFCGVPSSKEVVTLRGDEKLVKKRSSVNELSPFAKKRFEKAVRLFAHLCGVRSSKKIEIVEEFCETEPGHVTRGAYEFATDTVYLWKELLENNQYSLETIVGTLLHEHVHRITKAQDRTRDFENGLTDQLGKIALMVKM